MRFHDWGLQLTIKYLYSEHEIGDCFPDTSASVLGQKSGFLPVKMTT